MKVMVRARMVCAVWLALALGGVGSAQAAAPEPDSLFYPHLSAAIPTPPPLQSPCGLAVSRQGVVFVSNYYARHVEEVAPPTLKTVPIHADPLDAPCGIAFDTAGRLYLNNYHRNVVRYLSSAASPSSSVTYTSRTVIDDSHPTGVAVDPATDRVYVNVRTHVNVYESSGAPVMHEGEVLRIGTSSLGDGYGIAVSTFPATAGRVYVPDWIDDTVKVFDVGVDLDEPVQTISGPPGGFGSLRDSAVAVDEVSGDIYVADTRAYPQYTENPTAVIHVFDQSGAWRGRLKYPVVDGSPVGLAVDNSVDEFGQYRPTQGRVHVTTGNTIESGIYVYPPGSARQEFEAASPSTGVTGPSAGDASLVARAPLAETASAFASAQGAAEAGRASVIEQRGNLRVSVDGDLAPRRLPRKGAAPVRVSVAGQIATTDGSLAPQLKTLAIELNRHGRLERAGLPRCRYEAIQPGSSKRALAACRSALVGTGSFEASIILAGQEPYPSKGRLLLFNATERGKPVLYGHIHTARPFSTSFVIVFELRRKRGGRYGTTLFARIPRSMDSWGRLTALQMTLGRTYRAAGKRRSYVSAGCPAPKGFPGALFPLARTTFAFKGGKRIASTLISECKTRR